MSGQGLRRCDHSWKIVRSNWFLKWRVEPLSSAGSFQLNTSRLTGIKFDDMARVSKWWRKIMLLEATYLLVVTVLGASALAVEYVYDAVDWSVGLYATALSLVAWLFGLLQVTA